MIVDESAVHELRIVDTHLFGEEIVASYILTDKASGRAAIIETGATKGAHFIFEALGDKADNVDYLLVSHIHLDHAGASGTLMQGLKNAKYVVSARGARHMIDPKVLQAGAEQVYGKDFLEEHYGEIVPVPQDRIIQIKEETIFKVGTNVELRVEPTSGHAPHHVFISLFLPNEKSGTQPDSYCRGIFTGDQFAAEYPFQRNHTRKFKFLTPQSTPPQFDPEQWKIALNRVGDLNPQLLYLTHFGVIEFEKKMIKIVASKLDSYVKLVDEAQKIAEKEEKKGQIKTIINDEYFKE
ncbi:MAG: putative MBL fold metallo-hydrolase, partial [Streblomastix strix]